MAILKLIRSHEKTNEGAVMSVFLDGKEVATLVNGERKEFDIPPGPHTLKIKADSFSSKLQSFNIKEGGKKSFVIYNGEDLYEHWYGIVPEIILTIWYFTVWHSRFIKIKELDKSWA